MYEVTLKLDRDPLEYEQELISILDNACWGGDVAITGARASRLKELWLALREASI